MNVRAGIGDSTCTPWRGTFFPPMLPQAQERPYAIRQLTAIEVNGTFYRTQNPETFRHMGAGGADDFVFSIKGPRYSIAVPAFVELARERSIAVTDSDGHPGVADLTADFVYARHRRAAEDAPSRYSLAALAARDVFVHVINGAMVRNPAHGAGVDRAGEDALAACRRIACAATANASLTGRMSELFSDGGYRVLARKYRPANFSSLIGQDAMVKTLGNAIARGALAHAWLLTGVRGVGKTSTARIIAKALNCIGPDGQGGPTINPCGECEPCRAIAAGRHIDVVEMDAASNTGIDDVREIIEAVRYAAVSARFKIYIIDEVHMLSKNAFNALLKTLEEPPAHVKFIFATTEVQKVPITVLSRCQRFDLKRIPQDKLAEHFGKVAAAEGAEVEPEALDLVARAAEGSVRDGLSILDQAISHGHGKVDAQAVRDMLGLSDRGRVRELMATLLAGDAKGALGSLRDQYDLGVNPDMVVQELLELTHTVTRAKVAGATDTTLGEAERAAIADWAGRLSFPALHRLWQLLLKGLAEVQSAPLPIQAAEMALLRIIHASSLPDPADLVRKLTRRESDAPGPEAPKREAAEPELQMRAAPEPAAPAPVPLRPETKPADTVAMPADFAAMVRLFDEKREPLLAQMLHDDARLVRYAPPLLEMNMARGPADFAQRVMRCLQLWTGERWTVSLTDKLGQPTLHEAEQAAREAERQAVLADPAVRKLMSVFPNAELIDFGVDPDAAPTEPDSDEDIRRA